MIVTDNSNHSALSARPPRDGALDVLKVLAILGVLIIHVVPSGIAAPVGSFDWGASVFWGSLTRASVPVFLMCSGALLLEPTRKLTLKKLWGGNIVRIVAAMLFWAMLYKLYDIVRWPGFGALTWDKLVQAVKEVLLFKQVFHFYYLDIILLVYAFLPVTRAFVARSTPRERLYFLALWFVLGIFLPTAKSFKPFSLIGGMPTQWLLNMSYASIGYTVLGYELRQRTFRRVWPWVLCFLAGFAGTMGYTLLRSVAAGKNDLLFWEGMSPCVAMMAAGLFAAVTIRMPRGQEAPRLIAHLSKASFCAFLLHIFFLWELHAVGVKVEMGPALLTVPLVALAAYACCEGVYLLLSRIPFVNKYLL